MSCYEIYRAPNTMKSMRGILLFLGLSTLPIYYFPSGLPQPSHLFLSLFFLCSLAGGKITLHTEDRLLGALFLFSLVRETIAVVGGAASASLMQPIFTLFNLCILVFIRKYFEQASQNQRQFFILGICSASLVAATSVLLSGFSFSGNHTLIRATGTFNNPNQMAYFAVCLGAVALTLHLARSINMPIVALLLIAGLILIFAALSKAGLIAYSLILFVFSILATNRVHWIISLFAFIIIPVCIAYFINSGYFEQAYALQRLHNIGTDGDDTLYQRGYLMFQHFDTPGEIFFGLGSDKVRKILTHEVHSTLIYNLVNYSFIGFLLYTGFLYIWAKHLVKNFSIIAMTGIAGAPMLYGLAHNGTRFTIFYILIACGLSLAREAVTHKNIPHKTQFNASILKPFV